jgi:U3 small nucleolar RNA-associated protein MPP10
MGDLDAAFLLLEGFLSSPEESFVRPNVAVFAHCSKAAKDFFDCAKQGPIKGGPLSELLVEGFDSEQIWQQLELDNQPVLLQLETQATTLESAPVQESELSEGEGDNQVAEGDEGEEALSTVEEDEGDELLGLDGDGSDEEGDEALVSRGHKRSSEPTDQTATKRFRADRDPALGGNILKFDDQSSGEDDADEGDHELDDERMAGMGDGADEGDDGPEDDNENPFFDLEEMNKFADEGMEDGSAGEEEGDEEDEEEGTKTKAMKYKDFFDAPPPSKTKKGKGGKASEGNNEDDKLLSTFQKNDRDMKKRISAMEDELVAPRSWTLTGEVPAAARPSESLLQEDLDFEYATRPTEGLTEEGSMKLEDIIKGRIIDGLFDDVERKQAPKKKAFKPLEEVSSSKSDVGLAEVYEKEFLNLAKGDDEPTAAEAKLDKEHQEIATLFAQLCHKLDSLSDFSFTPKPPTEEVTVVTNAPAISMEENIPMGISSGTLTAPEEEYKSKSTGKPIGDTELEKKEKRTRRNRQKRLFEARAETRAREKGPDKKAETKEIAGVLNQRHVKEGVVSDTTKYGTSKEVFAKLTQTVQTADAFERKKKKKGGGDGDSEPTLGPKPQTSKAASFKL